MKQHPITTKIVHFKKDKYDIYVGRGSEWANPYTHIKNKATKSKFLVDQHTDAVTMYGSDLFDRLAEEKAVGRTEFRNKLLAMRGKTFGCTCIGWYKECHCRVIARVIEDLYHE